VEILRGGIESDGGLLIYSMHGGNYRQTKQKMYFSISIPGA